MGRQDLIVTPERWMARGEACNTTLERPLAVWQGIPGEQAEVHVYHHGQNQWMGRWVRSVGPEHPWRVEPPCGRYSVCGGCPLMHCSAAGQDEARRQMVADAFQKAGLAPPHLENTVCGADGEFGFRHVVKLAIGTSDRGHVRLGAFGRNSRDVVPIPECPVTTPVIRKAMMALAHHVIANGIMPYRSDKKTGLLRYAVIRQSRALGEVMITLVAAHNHPLLGQLAEDLTTDLADTLAGVHLHQNDGPGNAIFDFGAGFGVDDAQDGAFRCLEGRRQLEEEVAGVRIALGPGAFFQTNPAVADALYRMVVAELPPERPLVDLYCGLGGLTLAAATRIELAIGVEAVEPAVMLARQMASRQGLPAEFVSGRVEDALPRLTSRLAGTHPTVIVNPARRGLEEGVGVQILQLDPTRIIYISCNPRALANDLVSFAARGYHAKRLVPFNMFPQTAHLEVVAVLDREVNAPSGRRSPRRRRLATRSG